MEGLEYHQSISSSIIRKPTRPRTFTIRIYELLKQYQKIGARTFRLEELRFLLNIATNKYPKYGNLKQAVILPSQRELKAKTDLYFEFSELKQGHKVIALQFQIYPNIPTIVPKQIKTRKIIQLANIKEVEHLDIGSASAIQLEPPAPSSPKMPTALVNDMLEIGITKKDAHNLWQHACENVGVSNLVEYFQAKINLVKFQKDKRTVKNPASFLRKALDHNYINSQLEAEAREKKRRQFLYGQNKKLKHLEASKEQLRHRHETQLFQITDTIFQNSTPKAKLAALEGGRTLTNRFPLPIQIHFTLTHDQPIQTYTRIILHNFSQGINVQSSILRISIY